MPDISMCTGKNCPLKDKCFRHTAKPNEFYQSYFTKPPVKDGACDYYWEALAPKAPLREKSTLRKKPKAR